MSTERPRAIQDERRKLQPSRGASPRGISINFEIQLNVVLFIQIPQHWSLRNFAHSKIAIVS